MLYWFSCFPPFGGDRCMGLKKIFIKKSIKIDQAWERLEAIGISPLFAEEMPNGPRYLVIEGDTPPLSFITTTSFYDLPEVDWHAQWSAHGHQFHEGMVHATIGEKVLKLAPGAGFGDLSHPTTSLVLQLMPLYVCCKVVLDIGCGSGILSLAAALLHAKRVYGVDIDPLAVAHARKNAQINALEERVSFSLSVDEKVDIVLINMIWSEQREACRSWRETIASARILIASGLLIAERERYVQEWEKADWHLERELVRDGWVALSFCRRAA